MAERSLAAEIVAAISAMFEAAVEGGVEIEAEAAPLKDVEQAWGRTESGRRLVFVV